MFYPRRILYDLNPTETAEPTASLNLFASHFVRTALITRLQDLSGPPSQWGFGGGPV
jgi:hypothetical protein